MGIASYLRTKKNRPDETRRSRAFQEAALPHLDAAYRLARWLTRNHEDAEEVVQEAYLSAFRGFAHYRGGNARAWILAIVRNTFYSSLRQHHGATEPFDEEAYCPQESEAGAGDIANNDPQAILLRQQDAKLVQQALDQLPLGLREAMVLRTFDALSYNEIATIMNIPVGTVMSRLARARQHLAQQLQPLHPGWK